MRTMIALGLAVAMLAPAALAQAYEPPRTPSGKPDFQGVWTNVSLTTLERTARFKTLTLPADEAKKMEEQRARMWAATHAPTDPRSGAPTDRNSNAGYNTFWMDPGTRYGVVKGESRTSWIVDPPDGKIPYTPHGKKLFDEKLAAIRANFNDPETRPQGERCIVGFGSTGGPPMLNVLYNNNYQFVQTDTHLVILVEMIHDARIIPIGEKRPASRAKPDTKWLGDSVGWWEGDTLVVETANFHPDIKLRPNMTESYYIGENPKIIERFTRTGANEIHYAFTVEDTFAFARPWTAEMSFSTSTAPLYEYACHEGNYAMPGILAGARADERRGVATAPVGDAE